MRQQQETFRLPKALSKMNENFEKALKRSFGKMASKRKPKSIGKTKGRWVPK